MTEITHIFFFGGGGLITRNEYVKYESPISNCSKVIGKVKVFRNACQSQGNKVIDLGAI